MSADSIYTSTVEQLIGLLAQSHALGRDIDLDMCVSGLEPGRSDNRKVRDFVTKTLKIAGRDFDRALHMEGVRKELGRLPRTAREFVECLAEKKGITARYNGVLRMRETPYLLRADGTRDYIAPNLWDSYEFKTLIRTNFHRTIGFAEFQQLLRVRAAELRLDFSATAINDSSELWYADICRNRLWQIVGEIDYADSLDIRDSGQASLRRLAETCFHCPDGIEFVVAVFNKFIWQVKRKVEDLPITQHLMPVILGMQDIGKSTLIDKLLAPIAELWAPTDFRQITDDRNISLWRNFVLFLDEMGHARKSDLDIVKNVITARTLTRRIMRTNVTQEVAQNATFIGTANASDIGELIRDPTGLRRFVSLTMLDKPDWPTINTINWQEVWQSVDHTAKDPLAPFRHLLVARQEAERSKTPVEDWLCDYASRGDQAPRRFRTSQLHTFFRAFEDERYPNTKSSIQTFARELRRISSKPASLFKCIDEDGLLLWELRRPN